MELRFHANDDQINRIKVRTGMEGAAEVARDALALHDWATSKAQAGWTVAAVDPSGGIHTFSTPGLSQAQPSQQRW